MLATEPSSTRDALARFLTQLAAAAQQLAAELQTETGYTSEPEPAIPDSLGRRQQQAYEALLAAGKDMSTGEVNTVIGYDFSNTYMTLHRLEQLGLVELVPGSRPQRWRLRARTVPTAT